MKLTLRFMLGLANMPGSMVDDLDKALPALDRLCDIAEKAEPHLSALIPMLKQAWPDIEAVLPTLEELIKFSKDK